MYIYRVYGIHRMDRIHVDGNPNHVTASTSLDNNRNVSEGVGFDEAGAASTPVGAAQCFPFLGGGIRTKVESKYIYI
jgi:hypothetical protein